jgi:glutathione synthase/RimK-type ligase-like ATP-grasp enzyme
MNAGKRVALVTCEAFAGLYEDDLLLVAALSDLGIASVPAVWSDPRIDWTSFDALIMRTPWDYFERAAEFRAWLDARIAEPVLMCNSREILDWNFDKRYLQDLARAGVALVPTVCIAANEKADIAALARARGWDDIVVKPTIAGGGYRILRFRLEEIDRYAADIAETLEDRGVLVQPFLPEIQSGGELSLLFFDGVFSHAVRKRPKPGDYRVQFQFGGSNENTQVSEALVAQARVCVEHAPAPTVYARVDGVVRDGSFLLMELEIFEPLMFLARHPEAPARFARAIEKRLLAPVPSA